MFVRVLGEVSLTAADGTVCVLPGGRQPALLAALAARAGEVVGVDRLVDLIWGDAPPDNPAAALHSAVFKLRVNISRISDRGPLVTRDPGYLLDLHPGELDSQVFEALVQEARDLPPAAAADTLGRALGLWRGRAYDGFGDTDLAGIEALRLEELRRVAVERCGAALLASERAAEAVALLQPFVAEHPLREAGRITLMKSLQAEGRTPEALEHYQVHRRELADELGLEPSPALEAAQLAVLRGTPPVGIDDGTRGAPGPRRADRDAGALPAH